MPLRAPRFQPGIRPGESAEQGHRWFAFRRRELLVTQSYGIPTVESLGEVDIEPLRTQYLGTLDGAAVFSAELAAGTPDPPGGRFCDLRALFGRLDEELHALAGRAIQIMEWDRTHQFCGACGGPTLLSDKERSRSCPDCQLVQYPRLSPAMIVAVERDDQILLGRSPHFPAGIYSVLAGFVEPGESLEEAVAREVWEETAIEVQDVRYFGSQPWPFPNSLMLGCTARYRAGEISVDGDELEDADWFRADEFPATFPGRVSISQWLMEDFVRRSREGSS